MNGLTELIYNYEGQLTINHITKKHLYEDTRKVIEIQTN
jgi:hypothetical protein